MVDDVRIMGSKANLLFTKEALILHPHGGQPQPVEVKMPKGYPTSPGDNFTKLLTGNCKTNHVDAGTGCGAGATERAAVGCVGQHGTGAKAGGGGNHYRADQQFSLAHRARRRGKDFQANDRPQPGTG